MVDVFVRIDSRAAYPHVLGAVESWRPDLVLFEETENAAPLAAETAGVPAVCVGITARAVGDEFRPQIEAAHRRPARRPRAGAGSGARALRRRRPSSRSHRRRSSSPAPPARTARCAFARRTATGRAPLPAWWSNDSSPLVYLTFGSVAPTMDFFPGVYRDAIDALSLLPVRVLVTVGRDRDPRELGPLAPNVHAARWVPQADVMPHAAAMVCHGGFGTVRAGLAAGVPMVVLPLFADQPYNARRVAELGAGIELEAGTDGLADAVRRLLAEPSYREAAQRVAAETRQLPTVDTATAILRQLALAA